MKKKHPKIQKYIMTREVREQIRTTIESDMPELGGFLGTSDGINIDHFYFDHSATTTGSTYTPDTEAVNAALRRWQAMGVKLIGNIHSYPGGYNEPSPGDIRYAKDIMDMLDEDSFIVTIDIHTVFHGANGIYFYMIYRDGTYEAFDPEYEKEYRKAYWGNDYKLRQRLSQSKFDRIKDFLPHGRSVAESSYGRRHRWRDPVRGGSGSFWSWRIYSN